MKVQILWKPTIQKSRTTYVSEIEKFCTTILAASDEGITKCSFNSRLVWVITVEKVLIADYSRKIVPLCSVIYLDSATEGDGAS